MEINVAITDLENKQYSNFLQDNLSQPYLLIQYVHAFHTLFDVTITTTITIIMTKIVNTTTITTTTIPTNLHVSTYREVSLVHTKIQSITIKHSGMVAKISLHLVYSHIITNTTTFLTA